MKPEVNQNACDLSGSPIFVIGAVGLRNVDGSWNVISRDGVEAFIVWRNDCWIVV